MKAILAAAAVMVMLAGCSFDTPGPGPAPDTDWNDAAVEQIIPVDEQTEPTPIEPVPDEPPQQEEPATEEPAAAEAEEDQQRELGVVPPDPLAAEPDGKKKAKAGRQPEFWLFCYGGEWCEACRYDKPQVQAWANRNGLTTSEANVPDSRLSQVQFVDVTRDKVTRDLAYDKPRPAMYPTYLIVDADGRTVWKRAASRIDIEELDLIWGLLNY